MSQLSKFTDKFKSISTIILVIAVAFGFSAGSSMALDEAVTHHAFGVATWALVLTIIFIWIISGIMSAYVKSYKEARGTESGRTIEFFIKATLGLTAIIMTITALAIH